MLGRNPLAWQGHIGDIAAMRMLWKSCLLGLVAAGTSVPVLATVYELPTTGALLAASEGFALGDVVSEQARQVAQAIVGRSVAVEVLIVDRDGKIAGHAPAW